MVIEISIAVIAVAVVVITIYLVPALQQVRQTASTVERTIKSLDARLQPVLEQTERAMRDISEITRSMKEQVSKMEDSIENYRNLIDRVNKISVKVYDEIEQPILRTMETVRAFRFGWKTFFSALISQKKEE